MSNAALTLIFKIHDITATGTVLYQESHSVTSNAQGLVICNVGNGTPTQGAFANINWGNGAKFLHVLMNAGNGELDLGTQQMMSVPYALYAEKSGGSVPSGSAPGELMYWNGEGWSSIPPGSYGQTLFLCDGVPTWGGCVPKLDSIVVNGVNAVQESDGIFRFDYSLICNLDPGLPSLNWWESQSGFYVSTDSIFSENELVATGVATSIVADLSVNYVVSTYAVAVYLPPATTFFVKAFCRNRVGTGFSPVSELTTPSAIISGCTYSNYCNYNPLANVYDGSCSSVGMACNDNNPSSLGSVYNGDCQCVASIPEYTQVSGVEDTEGNFYPSVIIYGQEWMQQNLAVTTYRNGDPITLLSPGDTPIDVAAYAYYNNDLSNVATYGNLYNWYVVGDVRGVCPSGWHVPTDSDWNTLFSNLNIVSMPFFLYAEPGTKLKSTEGWPNIGGGNEFGFSALPGGWYGIGSGYYHMGENGFWWSGDLVQPGIARGLELLSGGSNVVDFNYRSTSEFLSLRCIKD